MASRGDGPGRWVVYDPDGGLLGDGPDHPAGPTPTPSPSGDAMIFATPDGSGNIELSVVSPSGTKSTVPPFDAPACWDWSDEQHLMVARFADGNTEVELRSIETNATRKVATLPGDWCIARMNNQSAVVVGVGLEGRNTVVTLDLQTGTVRPIAEFDCNFGDVRVSPDGRTAAISAACVGAPVDPITELPENAIVIVNLRDGSFRRIGDGIWTSPSFTPDGGSIIAADLSPSGSPDTSRLVRIDLDSDDRTVLVDGGRLLLPVALRPVWRPR